MKIKTLVAFCLLLIVFNSSLNAQIVYGTLGTGGLWSATANWETYSNLTAAQAGSSGSGTAAATIPSATHFVFVRNGATVTTAAANRGCKSIIIQNGGKLWANEATARRLQIGLGGTGFTYPLVDTVNIDGTLGGLNDGIFIETGAAAQTVRIWGNGTVDIQRVRTPGGAGSAAGGVQTINIEMDMNLWQAANYAFSCKYNPTATDNYTVNIAAGKTIAVKAVDGYFHNSSGAAAGTYTYNINGTVDLTASTQTLTNLTAFSETVGTVNLNVSGLIKTGAAFNSSPVSPGVDNLTIKNGGVVDATLATVMNFNGNNFNIEGTGLLRRTARADGSRCNFPIATSFGGNNTAIISRDAATGTTAVYDVNIQSTFSNPPADANLCVNKQWNISLFSGTASNGDTLRLSWTTADQAAGFNPAGTVNIMHWNGTTWDYLPATVTGTGTALDPYVAKAVGVTSYSPFGVTNSTGITTPVTLVHFNANYNGSTIKLNWNTTNEVGVEKYVVQRSSDGRSFTTIGHVMANNNSYSNHYNYTDGIIVADKLYYRLLSVDIDGKSKYSNVIAINTKLVNQLQVYPNPSSQLVTIVIAKSASPTSIAIANAEGKMVKQLTVDAGTLQTSVYIGDLPAGNYSITATGTARKSILFTKQ